MPQDDRLFESLTVEETLLYAARLKLRVNREGRASRVRSVLKALGLTDVHKEVIKNVSGGNDGGPPPRSSCSQNDHSYC